MTENDKPTNDAGEARADNDVDVQERLDGDDTAGDPISSEALVDGDTIGAELRDD